MTLLTAAPTILPAKVVTPEIETLSKFVCPSTSKSPKILTTPVPFASRRVVPELFSTMKSPFVPPLALSVNFQSPDQPMKVFRSTPLPNIYLVPVPKSKYNLSAAFKYPLCVVIPETLTLSKLV